MKIVLSDHSILSHQYAHRGLWHHALLRASIARYYRRADAVVGVSQGVADDLTRLGWLPSCRVKVIHNPIEIEHCTDHEALRRAESYWKTPRGKRVLSVGRFKTVKNHQLLIEAFARLPDSGTPELMLVGEGPLEGQLRKQVARLGLEDRVIFAGFQSDPAPFYASADLFVLSSNLEGFGNVLVEAMAQGTSIVSTDCPTGPSEILEDGRYGRLVPVGDVEALAQAIADGLKQVMDQAILIRRASDFSPEIAAQRYLQLWESGLSKG